jgi:hypothetical protein
MDLLLSSNPLHDSRCPCLTNIPISCPIFNQDRHTQTDPHAYIQSSNPPGTRFQRIWIRWHNRRIFKTISIPCHALSLTLRSTCQLIFPYVQCIPTIPAHNFSRQGVPWSTPITATTDVAQIRGTYITLCISYQPTDSTGSTTADTVSSQPIISPASQRANAAPGYDNQPSSRSHQAKGQENSMPCHT